MKTKITDKIIENFRVYLLNAECSENTVAKYTRDVRRFAHFTNGERVEKSDVLRYKAQLCKTYAPRSVNSVLSALNSFFGYINRNDLKVRTLKIQQMIFADSERELTQSDFFRLLDAAKKSGDDRLYCLMQTLASTGIRISELRYITCNAVKEKQTNIDCKGKMRRIFLPKKLCKLLAEYIKRHGICHGEVFVSRSGNTLNRTNIWRMLKRLCGAAGVNPNKVFPHNFRHLFARTYYKMQKDIVRLADILGHSSINTTRIYTTENGEGHIAQLQKLSCIFIRA